MARQQKQTGKNASAEIQPIYVTLFAKPIQNTVCLTKICTSHAIELDTGPDKMILKLPLNFVSIPKNTPFLAVDGLG